MVRIQLIRKSNPHVLFCILRALSYFTCFVVAAALSASTLMAGDWLQWGGPNGDFTVPAKGLADTWPEDGPRRLWRRPLGDGYSAILFKSGRLYTMFRDGNEEVVSSLDAKTGKTLWEHRYRRRLWSDMDEFRQSFTTGPNATPLIVGDRLLAIGIAGRMRCLELASGKLLWLRDLPAEYGRRKRDEEYGYSGSPLPYGDKVIVLVGGEKHRVIAVNPLDGATVWKSEPGAVSYAAPRLTTLAGQDQYIFFTPEDVVGLDPASGRILWRWRIPVDNGNHLTPIVKCSDNHIWVSSQFASGGGRLLHITREGDRWKVEELWFKSKLRGSCWTSIRLGAYIYGSAGGHNVSLLTAFNWRTGSISWQERGFHMAQCLYADGKLLFLDEGGKLTLAKVSPRALQVLASAQVTTSVSWTLPTLVDTKLYLRDRKQIIALDLAAPSDN